MSTIESLFTEKFRPKQLPSLIVPERIKRELSRGLVQNLLLYGSPGTGKCVDGKTVVTVRNKKTKEILNISIEDFKNLIK